MTTIGYILLLAAALAFRAVVKGRAGNITEDMGDAFVAFIRGDGAALKEVASRTGESGTPPQATTPGVQGQSGLGGSISTAAKKLAVGAVYGWGATGPKAYDCSGLMWRACLAAGVYTGARFTTSTILLNNQFVRVTSPQMDDLVVWPGRHMGVVTGKDKFFSARNYQSGIGESSISGWGMGTPRYYRPLNIGAKNAGAGTGAGGGGGGSW